MIRNDRVDILLATYNGAAYVEEQILSLINQTYENLTITIHDDGSTDSTIERIRRFEDERIKILDDGVQCGSAQENFLYLLNNSNENYICFCDQDDLWELDKVERQLSETKRLEGEFGSDKPIVVFSDLKVVNRNLELISPSLWRMQNTTPRLLTNIKLAASRNVVTGCTMLLNAAAISLVKKNMGVGSHMIAMHDWWITLLVMSNNGIVTPVDRATVYYRQHEGNVVGAQKFNFLKKLFGLKNAIGNANKIYSMSKGFNIYPNKLEFYLYKTVSLFWRNSNE